MCVHACMHAHACILSLSLSLSPYINTYIQKYTHIYIYIYIPKVTAHRSRSEPKVIQNHPHIPRSDPKVTGKCTGSLGCSPGWRPQAPLNTSESFVKICLICLWAHLSPIEVAMLTTLAQKNGMLMIMLRKSRHVDDIWRKK